MKPVTKWYRYTPGSGVAVLNHIEDGHSGEDKPVPHSAFQAQSWAHGEWLKIHATLRGGEVVP